MLHIPLKRKIINIISCVNLSVGLHIEEISCRHTINALAQNPSHYLSLPEYRSLLNTEHLLYIERQGIQLCNKTVVFLMKEVTLDFQGSTETKWPLTLQNEKETYNRI